MTAAEDRMIPVVLPHAYPLDEFYANAGLVLPRIDVISAESLPQPCRKLLAHDGDMTSTLENFYGGTIHIEVIRSEERHGFYYREVILIAEGAGAPVEFGAIKISLDRLPEGARREIRAERLPFGTILGRHRVGHVSRPKAFLKLTSDGFISKSLGIGEGQVLYGRRNTLSNLNQEALAEVVEILPPAKG